MTILRPLLAAGGLLTALAATAASTPERPDVAIPKVSAAALAVAPRAEPNAEGHYVVDVLVLMTGAAEAKLSGGAGALVERLIAAANQYFANSLMPVRYRLVGLAGTSATNESKDYFENQADLAADGGVRGLRDRTGADLVALLRSNEASEFCGLGGLFNGGQQTDPPENVNPERDAFIVVGAAPGDNGRPCADLEHLFAHELGHSMGGGHQYLPLSLAVMENGRVVLGSYWKPYAHATYCGVGADGLRNNTIMMGGMRVDGVYLQGGELRADYFSSPAVSVDGLPCGNYVAGLTEGEADNARSISEAAPYVAAYREVAVAQREAALGSSSLGGSMLAVLALLALGRAGRRSSKTCPSS